MKKLLLALSLLGSSCPEPPRCHLQQVEVKYFPAHPCTKTKFANDGIFTYEGFCPEECRVVTTCLLWCSDIDAQGNVEKHPSHPTAIMNLGSRSARCSDSGQPLY